MRRARVPVRGGDVRASADYTRYDTAVSSATVSASGTQRTNSLARRFLFGVRRLVLMIVLCFFFFSLPPLKVQSLPIRYQMDQTMQNNYPSMPPYPQPGQQAVRSVVPQGYPPQGNVQMRPFNGVQPPPPRLQIGKVPLPVMGEMWGFFFTENEGN